jgi:hypothetical protein
LVQEDSSFQPNFYLIIPQPLQNEIYLLAMSCVLKRFPEMFVSDAKARDIPPYPQTAAGFTVQILDKVEHRVL